MPTAAPSTPDAILESQIFWDRHKTEIIAAVVIALLATAAFAGYRFYNYRLETSAAQALASATSGPDYQKVIATYAGTAASGTAALLLAEEQRAAGKFADANSTLQSFIDKNPGHEMVSTARMATAANLESLDKRDEALTMYQRIASTEPRGFNAPLALISQIHLLKEKGQIDEARRVCETVINQYHESYLASEATRQLRLLKRPAESTQNPVAAQSQSAPGTAAPASSASTTQNLPVTAPKNAPAAKRAASASAVPKP